MSIRQPITDTDSERLIAGATIVGTFETYRQHVGEWGGGLRLKLPSGERADLWVHSDAEGNGSGWLSLEMGHEVNFEDYEDLEDAARALLGSLGKYGLDEGEGDVGEAMRALREVVQRRDAS